ncbi:MAG: putative addiction module antidote protein [Candidatus Margulisbacteria bacterium]|jgi:probable addiction module antidote protein|nr:putative addiction module antidote protein [Candidatus Margulisiibacteriota bacterium]
MVKLYKWDTAQTFKNEAEIEDYLEYVFADGDPKLIARALGNAARARGMLNTARKTGLNRAGLYRALSKDGDPRLSTLTKVVSSLGFRLAVLPLKKAG